MKLGQQKSESRRLHGSLNSHGTRGNFSKSSGFGKEVPDKSSNQVQENAGSLFDFTSRPLVRVLQNDDWIPTDAEQNYDIPAKTIQH
jgi:hypothetical protein